MMQSKCVLVALVITLCSLPAGAWAASFVSEQDVFTPEVWTAPTTAETYYGRLEGHPHTFTFAITTPTEMTYQLGTKVGADPVSFLLVQQADRGVREVARTEGDSVAWDAAWSWRSGYRTALAPEQTVVLEPGTYKLEVSNPANSGRYQLAIQGGSTGGYWRSLRDVFSVHAFYGSWITALFTWQVVLLLLVVGGGWRWLARAIK